MVVCSARSASTVCEADRYSRASGRLSRKATRAMPKVVSNGDFTALLQVEG